ncbi:DUF4129 domain-containing protein [Pseudoduganella namucuonensis]|uniref:Uncharacterized protein n=1 Tax=Pseudoduganella namucuonensis TaxID=1035707 RepID=A0A1I7IJZ9_9BURK|nr:DUF4129 domain-containing protein [Pseudoduganella namucuonensis]SFU73235.1 protein of unknown function [Pseudoduganella namucuonensis]
MRLEHLRIALRPRPARQALDLGFALLHARAGTVYASWLALWLPLCAVAAALTLAMPGHAFLWMLLPWWLRPLLERAPLYVMSRQVFGEHVTWRQALRAWPGQLGGGWLRMLTWWRPFMAGRGLYQPVWQLENARGAAADARRAVIGRNGTGRAAYGFGLACAHFEAVLQFGLVAFIGSFASENQFELFAFIGRGGDRTLLSLLPVTLLCASGAIIGPIYAACCFTLYLNRRATLEAWDIELTLRQIEPPAARRDAAQAGRALPALLAATAVLGALLSLLPAAASSSSAAAVAVSPNTPRCEGEKLVHRPLNQLGPPHDAAQAALHKELEQLYDSEELRGYVCEQSWEFKEPGKPRQPAKPGSMPNLALAALVAKWLLIAGAVAVAAWMLYRYRDKLRWLLPPPAPALATEIGGLDIRAESLPDDVTGTVRAQWDRGERRAALALLYRATLSRLVQRHGLQLAQGATEGDCLRLARRAAQRGELSEARCGVADTATTLWLNGAYGGRWPSADAVHAACAAWDAQFPRGAGSAA